ncbi:RraA family protein [Pseudopelagicola sp. nBUS_19]|uniref:RraA family protein n=1 Tax=unclassified Pseudopelagicola TaxID=2649563 RepID=UPI003EBEFC3E
MNDTLLNLLQRVDTPTVCNAIEVAQGKRGFDAFTRGTMLASHPEAPAMVGYARTARIAAVVPPSEPPDVIKARRMAYYRHMAEGPRPSVAVIEDTDFPHCIGAFWGEINTTVHKGFGLCGTLTNGVMRDLGDLPDDYPVVAGSIGPSHGFVHVKEVGTIVSVLGMQVADGDLIHADRHGALVIPTDVLLGLEAAIHKLLDTEKLVLDPARQDDFDFDAFEAAWTAFENART